MKKVLFFLCLATLLGACSTPTRPETAFVPAKRLSATAQTLAPRAIVATPPPPAPTDAPQPPQPEASAIWRAGHYQFVEGRYIWISGSWVVPPVPGLVWVPGFFQRTAEGGLYINGHWRRG